MSNSKSPNQPTLESGELVRTPSGATARVIEVQRDEVLVEWINGERASFRPVHLKSVSR